MRRLIVWFTDWKAAQKEKRRVKIEGKKTRDAVGRAKRLREARRYKDEYGRTGNKNILGD